MDEDLFDAANRPLFPLRRQGSLSAPGRVVPGTSRPRTVPNPTSGDVPGRTLPDRSHLATRDDHSPIWAKHPKYIGNQREPLFTIGALAAALERDSNTMRAWITKGWLPAAQYRKKTSDVRGRRRYYTRKQIIGLVQIACEEGLLNSRRRSPGQTHFPQRAQDLFDRLASATRRKV